MPDNGVYGPFGRFNMFNNVIK